MPESGPTPPAPRARVIAFYLPQMYPIPENDEWWGKGFTEWISVAGAKPQFRGHEQPRVPADLGFYDLRLPETRIAQAELAAAYGVEGFCYWHYWFDGKRLLERPFDEVLHSGAPDFPFCLAWANQAWTDTWLGSGRVLQAQQYSHEDDVRHAHWLAEAFADHRYLTVDGRPVFVIYKPTDLPDPARTAETIRSVASGEGVPEPLVLGIDAFEIGFDYRSAGLDGTIGFEPNLGLLPHMNQSPTLARPWRKITRTVRNLRLGAASTTMKVHGYRDYVERSKRARAGHTHPYHPGVCVGWDNTPRRGRGAVIMVDDGVDVFERWLDDVVTAIGEKPAEERLVFVNAWNEWAEGNNLEPSLRDGMTRLEAVRRVVGAASGPGVRPT